MRRALICLLILIGGGAIWISLPPSEPTYNGKRLTVWLEGYDLTNFDTDSPAHKNADEAMQHIGTNAIPTLLRMLRAKDSAVSLKFRAFAQKYHWVKVQRVSPALNQNFEAALAFEKLGPMAKDAVPELIAIFDRNISAWSQSTAAGALGYIGPGASNAVPSLLRGAASTNGLVRNAAVEALGHIHASPELVVPVLMKCLTDPQSEVRWNAASSLGSFGKDANQAVPTLIQALSSGGTYMAQPVREALVKIDPDAATKANLK